MKRKNLWLIGLSVGIVLGSVFLYQSISKRIGTFTGSDEQIEGVVRAHQPSYRRWVRPWWSPTSPQLESLLFALQAAMGAALLGYVLGFQRGHQHAQRHAGAQNASHD